jgi:hypothetical protein
MIIPSQSFCERRMVYTGLGLLFPVFKHMEARTCRGLLQQVGASNYFLNGNYNP